jgi:predicted flap endonuclease-1-like 5' DNA nuclease
MKRKAPSNNDPVCCLQGIANGLSKCLNENGIYTVADFLRASEEDPEKLQHVILNKMSEKKI